MSMTTGKAAPAPAQANMPAQQTFTPANPTSTTIAPKGTPGPATCGK